MDLMPFGRMIDNDAAVGRNYQRLASQGLVDLYEGGPTTFDEYLEKSIGAVREPLLRLFPDLALNSLGNPLENGTFHFSKGTSTGFAFMNLSGGEKAAFDLILDLAIAKRSYDDTLFCIDEPESHMNARLQAELLSVLYELGPVHTIGLNMISLEDGTYRSSIRTNSSLSAGATRQREHVEPPSPQRNSVRRRAWFASGGACLRGLAPGTQSIPA